MDRDIEGNVEAVRRFNRLYTRQIGLLSSRFLDSSYSLTEGRVLYELAHAPEMTVSELSLLLGLDAGYLSRVVGRFVQQGLVAREASVRDGRQRVLRLTEVGAATVASLEGRSAAEIRHVLSAYSPEKQARLVSAMATIGQVLEPSMRADPYLLRTHGAGDMGWVVQAHGSLYAREYGFDASFEAFVARLVADFVEGFDPVRERCWIAERDGVNVGSVFVVRHPERAGVAKLRMLIVDPSARGLGIGGRLVEECVRFAQGAGYSTMTLWTDRDLSQAGRLYGRAGFSLVSEADVRQFGQEWVEQTWEREL